MISENINDKGSNNALISFAQCLLLAVSYVGSLYTVKSQFPRDHPNTIKQRILAVTIVCFIGPLFVWCFGNYSAFHGEAHFFKLLGLHSDKIVKACLLPLLLTICLFMGPIVLHFSTENFDDIINNIFVWNHLTEWRWYRQYIAAPISEELIFRACMLPIMVPNFGTIKSILITPLLFGVAHLHHIIEGICIGQDLLPLLLTACFQLAYTTIFGSFSAFLFLRTGHLIGPVICHSFCNMMGFPDFEGIFTSNYPRLIMLCFVLGLVSFSMLLFPLTDPVLYNSMYW